MSQNIIAIMAGNYNFSLVNMNKVNCSLGKTDIKVKVDKIIYYVYKAKTFEGSQQIDKLMDATKEYKLSEYKVN